MLNRHLVAPFVAAASCGVVLTLWACAPAQPARVSLNGAVLEPARTLPALTFRRTDGGTFTSADIRGRMSLFFFGYTHCAVTCPLTLAQFGQIRRALGSGTAGLDMYFVTLDPARDRFDWMRTYVANFPGVVGLIGSDADLARAQAAFGVIAERQELANGDYVLDHTAAIYMVDSAGEIQLAYPYGTPPSDIVADVQRLAAAAHSGSPAANT